MYFFLRKQGLKIFRSQNRYSKYNTSVSTDVLEKVRKMNINISLWNMLAVALSRGSKRLDNFLKSFTQRGKLTNRLSLHCQRRPPFSNVLICGHNFKILWINANRDNKLCKLKSEILPFILLLIYLLNIWLFLCLLQVTSMWHAGLHWLS